MSSLRRLIDRSSTRLDAVMCYSQTGYLPEWFPVPLVVCIYGSAWLASDGIAILIVISCGLMVVASVLVERRGAKVSRRHVTVNRLLSRRRFDLASVESIESNLNADRFVVVLKDGRRFEARSSLRAACSHDGKVRVREFDATEDAARFLNDHLEGWRLGTSAAIENDDSTISSPISPSFRLTAWLGMISGDGLAQALLGMSVYGSVVVVALAIAATGAAPAWGGVTFAALGTAAVAANRSRALRRESRREARSADEYRSKFERFGETNS